MERTKRTPKAKPAPLPSVEKRLHKAQGQQIRRARTKAGLTQAELAEKIGREQNTISRIETGENGASDKVKIELCIALGKDLDELFPWPMGLLDIALFDRGAA